MSLIWMFCRNWNTIFYIKCEFLFYYFKWLLRDFTLNNSIQTFIDIFARYIKSNNLFVILLDGERSIM